MPWVNEKEQGIFHPCSYRSVCAIQFNKPANKNQVLFEKKFFLKKSITNKPAFFIWFNKTDMSLFLLIYFHYSGIVYSQKFIKSCDLCNLTWLSFFHFLLNEVINSIVFWFQSSHTSHCFKSNFS